MQKDVTITARIESDLSDRSSTFPATSIYTAIPANHAGYGDGGDDIMGRGNGRKTRAECLAAIRVRPV